MMTEQAIATETPIEAHPDGALNGALNGAADKAADGANVPKRVVLEALSIGRSFQQGRHGPRLEILSGVDVTLYEGELVALIAPSGAGKSTLLQILGLLDAPSSGSVKIKGKIPRTDRQRARVRAAEIGFVYQFHHLLPEFSAVDNVALAARIAGADKREARARAVEILAELGLEERLRHHPSELSGGEQQRVAIARALACVPSLVLADEPTGNLDPNTADSVFEHFRALVERKGVATLFATHNHALARRAHRVLTISDKQARAARVSG